MLGGISQGPFALPYRDQGYPLPSSGKPSTWQGGQPGRQELEHGQGEKVYALGGEGAEARGSPRAETCAQDAPQLWGSERRGQHQSVRWRWWVPRGLHCQQPLEVGLQLCQRCLHPGTGGTNAAEELAGPALQEVRQLLSCSPGCRPAGPAEDSPRTPSLPGSCSVRPLGCSPSTPGTPAIRSPPGCKGLAVLVRIVGSSMAGKVQGCASLKQY